MYFHVFGDRPVLYQWDLNRRIVVDVACQEVHFSNTLDGEALVVETYTEDGVTYANIPNVLLQTAFPVNVYAYVCGDERFTRRAEVLEVLPRSKPADYVYTETEVKNYEALAARLDELEKNGVSEAQIKAAVDKYLEENPVDSGMVRFDEVQLLTDAEKAQARKNIGALSLEDLPKYEGAYSVTPSAHDDTTLETAQKYLDADVQVKKIPYYETDNAAGGTTIYIGSDEELDII